MKRNQSIIAVLVLCSSIFADVRIWIGADGQPIEGSFRRELLGRIQIEDTKGQLHLIPVEDLTRGDLLYLQKKIPPEVDISYKAKNRRKPEMEWTINGDSTILYTCTVTIDKKSDLDSKMQMTAELYVIAEAVDADNWVLQRYEKKSFVFPEGRDSSFEFTVSDIGFRNYNENWGGQPNHPRGEDYLGYLIVLLDDKGRVTDFKTDLKNEPWLADGVDSAVEKLRALAIEGRGSKYSRHFNADIKKVKISPIKWWQRFGGP